jgi:hypothetical protein
MAKIRFLDQVPIGVFETPNGNSTNNSAFSGSFTGSFTGSLEGTASWSTNALTASYTFIATSASFASTASYLNTLNQDLTFNGNLTLNSTITDISGLTGPNNYVLSATAGGVKWVISAPNNVVKYSATQSFSASVPYVINHNLNTQFYIIQLFDYPTGDEIMGSYTNRGLTQATITLSSNVSNVGVIIMG